MLPSSSKGQNRISRSHDGSRFTRLTTSVWVGLLLLCVGVSGSETPEPRDEAQRLLQTYFNALQTGNVAVLREVLGGEFGDSQADLLQNPEYELELVQSYAGSDFDVIDVQILESGDVVATVDTWLDASEWIRNRLTLSRPSASQRLRIVHREVVP